MDYASLDTSNEGELWQQFQQALDRGSKRRTTRRVTAPEPGPPQLPVSMAGQGYLTAAELVRIAQQCGRDKRCWRSALSETMKERRG